MPASSGPSLRSPTDPAEATPEVRSDLTRCWREVVDAGGAVGFAEQAPAGGHARRRHPRLAGLVLMARDLRVDVPDSGRILGA
jgi:hypothetical protein